MVFAQGITNCNYLLTNGDSFGIFVGGAVIKNYGNFGGAIDDVLVGDNITVTSGDDASASSGRIVALAKIILRFGGGDD